jgi:hypothetical protein
MLGEYDRDAELFQGLAAKLAKPEKEYEMPHITDHGTSPFQRRYASTMFSASRSVLPTYACRTKNS